MSFPQAEQGAEVAVEGLKLAWVQEFTFGRGRALHDYESNRLHNGTGADQGLDQESSPLPPLQGQEQAGV